MSHYPFATNTGSLVSGSEQYGNLAIGIYDVEYSTNYGGLEWAPPPSSDLFIATSPIEFWGTSSNDVNFINLTKKVTGQSFNDVPSAYNYLLKNNYYTSYIPPSYLNIGYDLGIGPSWMRPGGTASFDSGVGWAAYTTSSAPSTSYNWIYQGNYNFSLDYGGIFNLLQPANYPYNSPGTGMQWLLRDKPEFYLSSVYPKTFSIWIKIAPTTVNQINPIIILQKGVNSGFYLYLDSNEKINLQIWGRSQNPGPLSILTLTSTNTVNREEWYLITFTIQGNTTVNSNKLYINKNLEAQSEFPYPTTVNNSGNFIIPGSNSNTWVNGWAFTGSFGGFYVHEGNFTSSDLDTFYDYVSPRFFP